MDWITEIGFLFEYLKSTKNGFTKQVEQVDFTSFFCQIFDDFSKFFSAIGTLHFEKYPKIGGKWKKMEENLPSKLTLLLTR